MSMQGTAWDNRSEYPGLASAALEADLALAASLIANLQEHALLVAPSVGSAEISAAVLASAQEATRAFDRAFLAAHNARVFVDCEMAIDGRNLEAKAVSGRIEKLIASMNEAFKPVEQMLKLTSDDVVARFLAAPDVAAHRFSIGQGRKQRDFALSLPEESLIIALNVDGQQSWGKMYDAIATTIECRVALPDGPKTMGIAAAVSLYQSDSEPVRAAAYRAVQTGWLGHEESVAAVLNALAGWRLELMRKRSHSRPLHFLDVPLHDARIERSTLEAMMRAVDEAKVDARHALRVQAKLLGKDKLHPWDLFAPCPVVAPDGGRVSFADAIDIIADAYSAVDPEMGTFVRNMAASGAIEARLLPHKRQGGYCTMFVKSRSPRVFMTYNGGMQELRTLAHELGHAFHCYAMRELPIREVQYPFTLAETASIFGETVVNERLFQVAKTPQERLGVAWMNARTMGAFVLDVPARFAFERSFYERRAQGPVPPEELSRMMDKAWRESFGDVLAETDPIFWASKLHFSLPGTMFYIFRIPSAICSPLEFTRNVSASAGSFTKPTVLCSGIPAA